MGIKKKISLSLIGIGILALLGFWCVKAFQAWQPIASLDRAVYALNPNGAPNGLDVSLAKIMGGCVLYNGIKAPTSVKLSFPQERANFIHCQSPLSGTFQIMPGLKTPEFLIFRSPTNGITLELITGDLSINSGAFKIKILLDGISAELEAKEPTILHLGKNDKSGFYNISANSGTISISKIQFPLDKSSVMALEFEAGKTGKVIFESGHRSPVEGKSVLLLPSGFYD